MALPFYVQIKIKLSPTKDKPKYIYKMVPKCLKQIRYLSIANKKNHVQSNINIRSR